MRGEKRMVGSVRRFDGSEEEVWIAELMDKIFEKVRAPLKVLLFSFLVSCWSTD